MHWLNIWNVHCIDTLLMMSQNSYALPEPVIIIKWSNCVPDMGPTKPQGFLAHFCHLVELVFFLFFLQSCFWVACVSNLTISYFVLLMCWVSMSVLLCPVLYNPSILYKWQINEWTKKNLNCLSIHVWLIVLFCQLTVNDSHWLLPMDTWREWLMLTPPITEQIVYSLTTRRLTTNFLRLEETRLE